MDAKTAVGNESLNLVANQKARDMFQEGANQAKDMDVRERAKTLKKPWMNKRRFGNMGSDAFLRTFWAHKKYGADEIRGPEKTFFKSFCSVNQKYGSGVSKPTGSAE